MESLKTFYTHVFMGLLGVFAGFLLSFNDAFLYWILTLILIFFIGFLFFLES